MNLNSIKDQLYYSTVMIESAQSSGTAFLLSKTIGELGRVYLVTNKHVVKNQTECKIRFHKSESLDPSNKVGDFIHNFTNEEWVNGWKFHSDDDVDLAVFNLTETMATLHEQKQYIFYRCLDANMIATKEKAKERRIELLVTFQRMITYAKENDVHHILISGDLYDKKGTQ